MSCVGQDVVFAITRISPSRKRKQITGTAVPEAAMRLEEKLDPELNKSCENEERRRVVIATVSQAASRIY